MKPTRSLFLACLLAFLFAQTASVSADIIRRQGTTATTPPATPNLPTDTQTGDTSKTTPTVTSTSTTTTATTSSTSTTTSNTPTPTADPNPQPNPNTTPAQTSPAVTNGPGVTNTDGGVETETVTESSSKTKTTTPASQSAAPAKDSPALGTGSIIGMSVAGGIAVVAIIAFLVWKFTRKRFAEFDDNEAIKWPELNAHSGGGVDAPLPARDVGRGNFEAPSEVSLSRVPSDSLYSTDHLPVGPGGADPYAVPPLPHLNPNQPYRDDPNFYDPYRGPVPGTIETGTGGEWGGEAIPMNQMAGRASPGPHAAYDAGGQAGYVQDYGHDNRPYDGGIPAATAAAQPGYTGGRVASPGPQMAYGGGRSSPGPQVAYGGPGTGRASPGPQTAYGAGTGRASPGPQMAYGPR